MSALRNPVAIVPVPETARHANGLAAALPLEDMVGFFASQLSTYVRYDSVEYRNLEHAAHLYLGTAGPHSCNYQIRTEGLELGRITFTRSSPFEHNEIKRIECALGVLTMQLGKAMNMLQDEMACSADD